jgi:geranylgeranyl reductase family protein
MLDCIIVGAGPAGSGAAYHLAKRGRSVRLLEQQALPRYKPCAGGVSPQIAQWYDFSFEPVISQRVQHIGFTWKLGDPVAALIDTPEPLWMVKREIFDHYLVQQAQNQGAEVQDQSPVVGVTWHPDPVAGDHWQVETPQGTYAARYVIAADGCQGSTAALLGFRVRPPRPSLTLELPLDLDPAQASTSTFEFGLIKNGYVWCFPKADRLTFNAATMVGSQQRDLRSPLWHYVQHLGWDPDAGTLHTGHFALWDGHRPLHGRHCLLVGDAARLADPFSIEGIRPAMLSGWRAAQAIDLALSGDPKALAQYTQILGEDWNNDMVWASRIAGLFYRVTQFGYQIGVKRPSARARMGKILCGELRYGDVATRALKLLGSKFLPG